MKYSPIKIEDFAKYPAAKRNCTKYCTGCKVELMKTETEFANMYVNEEGKTRFKCDGCKRDVFIGYITSE